VPNYISNAICVVGFIINSNVTVKFEHKMIISKNICHQLRFKVVTAASMMKVAFRVVALCYTSSGGSPL
jgi:hypothetical protein